MNHFLDLSSVQKELATLPPARRSENLRTIRKEMGLDDAALQRWDELDKVRDTRWEVGSQYMSEREALAQQYSGPELEARLTELRARYFSDEAQTIAEEEQSGFYRFTRPRQWGRN
jgi:lipase chaperone LimK